MRTSFEQLAYLTLRAVSEERVPHWAISGDVIPRYENLYKVNLRIDRNGPILGGWAAHIGRSVVPNLKLNGYIDGYSNIGYRITEEGIEERERLWAEVIRPELAAQNIRGQMPAAPAI